MQSSGGSRIFAGVKDSIKKFNEKRVVEIRTILIYDRAEKQTHIYMKPSSYPWIF